MSVVRMAEFDLPKDEVRYKKFLEFASWRGGYAEKYKDWIDMLDHLSKEGKLKISQWSEGTGHNVMWWEFDNIETFALVFALDVWQKRKVELAHLVDNYRVRLLLPARKIYEDVIPY